MFLGNALDSFMYIMLQCSILSRGESAKILLQIVTETGGKHWSGWPLTGLKNDFSLFEMFGRKKKVCM